MIHLEHNALAGRKPLHRVANFLAYFLPEQTLFWVRSRRKFRLAIEEIPRAAFRFLGYGSLILAMARAATQVIEPHIRDDAVKPGVKAAFETKTVKVAVDTQKTFLVNVAGVFGAMDQ